MAYFQFSTSEHTEERALVVLYSCFITFSEN